MSAFERILAAVDDSPRAPQVAAVAADLARRFGARLYLFRALAVPAEFPAAAAHGTGTDGDQLLPILEQRAREQLRALAAAHPDVPVVEHVLGAGPPWRAILDAAARLDADLIVIGSHGYTRFERFLGTTAALIANRSDRSVLVVHERPPG